MQFLKDGVQIVGTTLFPYIGFRFFPTSEQDELLISECP